MLNDVNLGAIFQGLVCAGILWLIRTTNRLSESNVRVETILTGAKGDNGLVGDVKSLRESRHEFNNRIQELQSEHSLLAQRVDGIAGENAA